MVLPRSRWRSEALVVLLSLLVLVANVAGHLPLGSGHMFTTTTVAGTSTTTAPNTSTGSALLGAIALGAGAWAEGTIGTLGRILAAEGVAPAGQTVYRVWGGGAKELGRSWTPINPESLANPRDALGLPGANSGEFMSTARITNSAGISSRAALPFEGNAGGALEYVIPNPLNQLELLVSKALHPPF
ncbi:MAG TPA: hypothetical protein VG015_00005 [Candidatus Dormibacteraeota bacterium]|nr:hypothetical protein [Candidatus Dormibacteraeota bacterium]